MAAPTTDNESDSGAHQAVNSESVADTGKRDDDHYQLPDTKTLQEAGELKIKDEHGAEIPFESLFDNQVDQQQLIVFIRHFYCGHCEEYVRALARELPPSKLSSSTPPTTLTIIGCGEPECIPDYRTRTISTLDKPFPIYSDRSRQIYDKLGMVVNLKQGDQKPDYIGTSVLQSTVSSMWNIFSSGSKGFKGGKYSQNGGEWIFKNGDLKWCRRMRNTMDHTEVKELKQVLGLT